MEKEKTIINNIRIMKRYGVLNTKESAIDKLNELGITITDSLLDEINRLYSDTGLHDKYYKY